MTNQSEEILNYIKENPGASVDDIVRGTGWNHHLVGTAVRLMVEQGLVKEVGQTDWLDFKYEAIGRGNPSLSKIEQITAEIEAFVGKLNQDLQISSPGRLLDVSPFEKAASIVLDKEDIKRTMEERARYTFTQGIDSKLSEIIRTSAFEVEQHTFIVTLPNSERREVKAHYMEVDGGSLYFEDEDHETILAFGPGHWVWAERVEENE